jgi:hypothetical protein
MTRRFKKMDIKAPPTCDAKEREIPESLKELTGVVKNLNFIICSLLDRVNPILMSKETLDNQPKEISPNYTEDRRSEIGQEISDLTRRIKREIEILDFVVRQLAL